MVKQNKEHFTQTKVVFQHDSIAYRLQESN